METWVFFVVVTMAPFAGDSQKYGGKLFGPFSNERACTVAQGHVELERGMELLHITPCIKVPNREKT